MKPYKMKAPNCGLFSVVHIVLVLYFPLENIVPEIVLHVWYNKTVKVLLTLMHYEEVLHSGMVSRQI